jgi:hypothetical protein
MDRLSVYLDEETRAALSAARASGGRSAAVPGRAGMAEFGEAELRSLRVAAAAGRRDAATAAFLRRVAVVLGERDYDAEALCVEGWASWGALDSRVVARAASIVAAAAERRENLRDAFAAAGFRVEDCEGVDPALYYPVWEHPEVAEANARGGGHRFTLYALDPAVVPLRGRDSPFAFVGGDGAVASSFTAACPVWPHLEARRAERLAAASGRGPGTVERRMREAGFRWSHRRGDGEEAASVWVSDGAPDGGPGIVSMSIGGAWKHVSCPPRRAGPGGRRAAEAIAEGDGWDSLFAHLRSLRAPPPAAGR